MDYMVTNDSVYVSNVCPDIDLNGQVIRDSVGNVQCASALCWCYIVTLDLSSWKVETGKTRCRLPSYHHSST